MLEWLKDEERASFNSLYQINHSVDSNKVLDDYMNSKRLCRPILSQNQRYEIYESNGLAQLWFQTPPCRFSTLGKCTMCNYWNGNYIPGLVNQIVNEVEIRGDYHTLLINTCGSCLDPKEVPRKDLISLLKWISDSPVKKVIFESHWTTLTSDTLSLIHSMLFNKTVFYEIGIESTNPDSLFYLLNKPTSATDLNRIISKIHLHNAQCIINVVFGILFLNPEEQIKDTVESIQDLLKKKSDYLVLFPINIKPYTLVMDLYKQGQYARVPVKIIANLLLDNFGDDLDKINVAWFGDRFEEGVIPPASCDICGTNTVELLKKYNDEDKNDVRRVILESIVAIQCDCIKKYTSFKKEGTLFQRLNKYYSKLS